MRYNTSREHLAMPEYGRHIQSMVDHIRTIEDKEKRQKNAETIIELMGVLNPHLRNVEDFRHKLWDHLFLIADFDLDVDSPYPIPTREKLSNKPVPVPYPEKGTDHMHLGKNLMTVLDKALNETDEEKRDGLTQTIVYYMKLAYTNWHKEMAHEETIKEELSVLSQGKLDLSNSNFKLKFNNHKKRSNGNNNKNNNNSHSNGGGHYNRNKKNNNKNKRK